MKTCCLSCLIVLLVASMACAEPRDEITTVLEAWHQAAAEADADVYFGTMTEDCVFLGTDATERWTRDELRVWSKTYFDRGSAWAFTAHDRVIYFAGDGHTAWFEEFLETDMGDCRASGVMSHIGDRWLIRHYDLTLTVPNELVDRLGELVAGLEESR